VNDKLKKQTFSSRRCRNLLCWRDAK